MKLLSIIVMILFLASPSGAQLVTVRPAVMLNPEVQQLVDREFQLQRSRLITLVLPESLPDQLTLVLALDGLERTIPLSPASVCAADYELLVQQPDGTLRRSTGSATRTMRGEIEGEPSSSAAASVIDGHLRACIVTNDHTFWIEPIAARLNDPLLSGVHVVYRTSNVRQNQLLRCDMPNLDAAAPFANLAGSDQTNGSEALGQLCSADLACDSDVEYFEQFGSVEAVEAHIHAIVNVINVQYESQAGIHHNIAQLIVRPDEPDPYTATDSLELLCELTQEWTNNLPFLKRDLTMLFSGHDTGDIVGRASNFGDVCNEQGCCECGMFGTDGSYCYARTEWDSGSFAFATAVTAHELGHLWGAYHCNCAGFTMHYTVPIGNSFASDSISAIEAYRDTRTCLTCEPTVRCVADFNDDGEINILDLLHLIEHWGPCMSPCPPSCTDDTDGNCVVNVLDLVHVLDSWGRCP